MKILITGFDPFGGEKVNPALEAVKLLPNEILGSEIIKLEIPTVFRKSHKVLREAIIKNNPDVVISVGQASGRFGITPERVAINIDDARIADNEGNQPIDERIFEDGKEAYFSNLPIKAMVAEIKENGLPASVSNTAGTFVCNHVMYSIMYMIEKEFTNIRGGFIHVPCIPAQVVDKVGVPSMSVADISKGLEYALRAVIKNDKDIKTVGGAIC
ncbi:pyroglutamyl-peptidase I [Clostridium mediterraneense]|uniref:pyroglutamyl-peptidase I n=1 Tax=Clostridium mediterraneense TaxID=1805472 RepID=UPI000832AA1A|nr:pyroglutamyl-peptidase I [Clostridium mediterraneense]